MFSKHQVYHARNRRDIVLGVPVSNNFLSYPILVKRTNHTKHSVTGAGRRFFLATRIFEISRAIIYSSETFLARAEWQSLMGHMWVGGGAKDWHPKEALYDLMISCSALGVRSVIPITQRPSH